MFINRSDKKIKTQKIANEFTHTEQLESTHNIDSNSKEIEIVNYPVLSYLFGSMLIGLSIYLIYSASGGPNSI